MSDIICIEPGSEAWVMLAVMIGRTRSEDPRSISIMPRPGAVQLKWGGGTWTTPMRTSVAPLEDADKREFVTVECGHLVCKRCGGHKHWREADDEPVSHSCGCCKICGQLDSIDH